MINPALYVIMRTDLASLNSGKGMAQACHAANAFKKNFEVFIQNVHGVKANIDVYEEMNVAVQTWENQTPQGFGTTIVLGGKMSDILETVEVFRGAGYLSEIIHDPTYPLVDGEVVHLIPLDTCAYIFVADRVTDTFAKMHLQKYDLHR